MCTEPYAICVYLVLLHYDNKKCQKPKSVLISSNKRLKYKYSPLYIQNFTVLS